MPVPVSSLSVAVQGIADFLDSHFTEDVVITIDTPQRASERAKTGDKHFLNLFVYRVAPSGLHPDLAADQTSFIRVNALITPFLTNQGDVAADADLRILGHLIRVLQSHPVVPGVLPGAAGPAPDFRTEPHLEYRLQAVLQTPSMEELNHIWTTQGGDLAYRLSAAYEFALIPVEPLQRGVAPAAMTTAILDVLPDAEAGGASGFIDFGDETSSLPLGGIGPDSPPTPTSWLPVLLLAEGASLSNAREIPPNTPSVAVGVAGPPGERVALEVSWTRQDESQDRQAPQVFTIATPRIDEAAAIHNLNLTAPQAGDRAVILTRPVDEADQVLPTSPFANTLVLTVEGP